MKASKQWVLDNVIQPVCRAGFRLPYDPESDEYAPMVELWCNRLSANFDLEVLQAGTMPFIDSYRKRFRLALADLMDHFDDVRLSEQPIKAAPRETGDASAEAHWQASIGDIRRFIGVAPFLNLCAKLVPVRYNGEVIELQAPSKFVAEFLPSRYGAELEKALDCKIRVLPPAA